MQRLKEFEKRVLGSAAEEGPQLSSGYAGQGIQIQPTLERGYGVVTQEDLNSRIDQILHDRLQKLEKPPQVFKDPPEASSPTSTNVTENSSSEPATLKKFGLSPSVIVFRLRKKFQKKALALLERLERHDELMQWDQNGIVTFDSNRTVPGASIFSLIRATFYPLAQDNDLPGLQEYLNVLKTLDLASYIKNPALKESGSSRAANDHELPSGHQTSTSSATLPGEPIVPLGDSETLAPPNPDKFWFFIGDN